MRRASAAATKSAGPGRRPVLVTGVPRSGTTWLARELAGARYAGLPGREPMNPRPGQFALGGSVRGWTDLAEPTNRQTRLLERCYRGHEPRAYSRYGTRQWVAVLPWSRTIVKDPFALLSVPAIVRATGAVPVILYRHPGAVLASYRRMGWTADTAEIRALRDTTPGSEDGSAAYGVPEDDVAAMVEFWTFLHQRVLTWLDDVPGALLVSHAELSLGGPVIIESLMRACGLRPRRPRLAGPGTKQGSLNLTPPESGTLHGFARQAEEVTGGWRSRLAPEEVARVQEATAATWSDLEARRARLL